MTSTAEPTHTMKVKEIDRVYEINGTQLKRCLNAIGMTQVELAKRCGYSGASRVCHLIKGGKTRISGKYLKRILKVLEQEGAEIEGFEWH